MDIVREEHAQRLLEDLQYKFRNMKIKYSQDLIEERKKYQIDLANAVEKFEGRKKEYETTLSEKNKKIAKLTHELELLRDPVQDSSPAANFFDMNVNCETEVDIVGVQNEGAVFDLEKQGRGDTRSPDILDEGSDFFHSDEQMQESAPSTIENVVQQLEPLVFENPYTEESSIKVDWTFYGPQSNDQDSPAVECPLTFFIMKKTTGIQCKKILNDATTLLNSRFGTDFTYRLVEMKENRVVELVQDNTRIFPTTTSTFRIEVITNQNSKVEEDDVLIEIAQKSTFKPLPTFILKIKRQDNWIQIRPRILNVLRVDDRQLKFSFVSIGNSTTLNKDTVLFPYCVRRLDFLTLEGHSSFIQVEHLSIDEMNDGESNPRDDDEIEVDDAESPSPPPRRTRSGGRVDSRRVEPHRKSRQSNDEAIDRKGEGMNEANRAYWRERRNNNNSGPFFKAFIVPQTVDGKTFGFFQLKEISAQDAMTAKYRLGFLPCRGCAENRCPKISTFFTSRSSIYQRLWDLFSIYDKPSICINIYNEEMTLGHRWNIGNAQSFVVSDDLEPIRQAKFLFINRYRFENSNIQSNYRHIEEITVLDDETEERIQVVKGLTISRSQLDAPNDEDPIDFPPTPYQCQSCEMTFSNFAGFSNHLCPLIFLQGPDNSSSASTTTRRLRSSTTRKRKSTNVQESTTNRLRRTVQKRESQRKIPVVHSNTKTFPCSQCSFTAKSKSNLLNHEKRHQNTRPFQCSLCPYAGKLNCDLKIHMSQVHLNIRNFCCPQCSYTAKTKSNLAEHEKRHRNVRPFKCSLCPYAGKLNCDLKIHMSVVHSTRNFPCSKCSYNAKTKSCLTEHEKRHQNIRPFKCSSCPYAGKCNSDLKRHMLVHSNVRNFPCPKCSYKAKNKFCLTQHSKTH